MDRERIIMKLELIAAKAKLLASDVRNGKLWEGDLARGVGEIAGTASELIQDVRTDR